MSPVVIRLSGPCRGYSEDQAADACPPPDEPCGDPPESMGRVSGVVEDIGGRSGRAMTIRNGPSVSLCLLACVSMCLCLCDCDRLTSH